MDLADPNITQTLLFSLLLVAACLIGDKCVSMLVSSDVLYRAAADNVVHGVVGVISWAVVEPPGLQAAQAHMLLSCALCGALASAIDLDHFLAARSLHIKDAVSLKQRPPLHSTTLALCVVATLFCMSALLPVLPLKRPALLGSLALTKFALMCLTAWLSHHLRDASRRGLWFPPFGSTPPIPYPVYILGTVMLAWIVHVVFVRCVHSGTGVALSDQTISEIVVQ